MTAWNTTETVTTTGPEKVGGLTGPHAERLHHLDGLPPRGPEWGQEENARLAHLTGLPVVSVFYRLCHDGVHHPVPHEDCWAAYQWVRSGGHGIATDPARVAVGGASAGACLAATVWPPRTRRRRGPRPGLPRLPHRPLPATPSHGRARRRPGHAPAGPVRRPRR